MRQAIATLTFLVVLVANMADATANPKRIVSVNLCADQLLLALAEPQQIVALSRNATSRLMSHQSERAASHRLTSGHAEDVLLMNPDLVIAGRFAGGTAKAAMRQAGLNVHDLDVPGTPEDAAAQIETFGALIGQGARGLDAADVLRSAFADARRLAPKRRPTAIYLQRRGIVTGGGTMMDALMDAAGFENAVAETGFLQIGLERLLTIDADILILDGQGLRDDGDAADQGAAILAHPIVDAKFPAAQRLVVPNAEIICAGPSLADAVKRMSEAATGFTADAATQ